MSKGVCACTAEVAKFKLFVVEQDVFYFDVSVGDRRWLRMQMQKTSANIFQNMDSL